MILKCINTDYYLYFINNEVILGNFKQLLK